MMDILVIGSMNMDLVVKADRYPVNGETVIGSDFQQIPGGKGANQACAIAKLGGKVGFIGACGEDEYGKQLLTNLENCGVDTGFIETVDKSTGIAAITVEKNGDNRIIIIPGANKEVSPNIIENNKNYIKKANIILLQLEIPLNTVIYTIKMAKKYNKTVILDPAPARKLPINIYNMIDFILPNEVEIEGLIPDENLIGTDTKVKRLLELGIKNVILTQGSSGVTLYTNNRKNHYSAEKLEVMDTTAAGDAFAGAFAHYLNLNYSIEEAIKYANIAAGLTVTKLGAQSSLPDEKTINEYLSMGSK